MEEYNQRNKEQCLCPMCDDGLMIESYEKRDTHFGENQEVVSAIVPVFICSECGFEYTDDRASKIFHESVCKKLGVLAPKEILKEEDPDYAQYLKLKEKFE